MEFKTPNFPPGLPDKLSEINSKGHVVNKLSVLDAHPSPTLFLQCYTRSIIFPSHNCLVSEMTLRDVALKLNLTHSLFFPYVLSWFSLSLSSLPSLHPSIPLSPLIPISVSSSSSPLCLSAFGHLILQLPVACFLCHSSSALSVLPSSVSASICSLRGECHDLFGHNPLQLSQNPVKVYESWICYFF